MDGSGRPQGGSALRELYGTHALRLRNVIARLCGPGHAPEDLMHDVFEVALSQRHRFGPQGPPAAWLYGIAVKVAQASRRRSALRRFLRLEDAPEPVARDNPDDVFARGELARRMYAHLAKLSEAKRTVFVLYELEELSGEEIAEALGVPLNTVWTRLARARKAFAALVAAEAPDAQ